MSVFRTYYEISPRTLYVVTSAWTLGRHLWCGMPLVCCSGLSSAIMVGLQSPVSCWAPSPMLLHAPRGISALSSRVCGQNLKSLKSGLNYIVQDIMCCLWIIVNPSLGPKRWVNFDCEFGNIFMPSFRYTCVGVRYRYVHHILHAGLRWQR